MLVHVGCLAFALSFLRIKVKLTFFLSLFFSNVQMCDAARELHDSKTCRVAATYVNGRLVPLNRSLKVWSILRVSVFVSEHGDIDGVTTLLMPPISHLLLLDFHLFSQSRCRPALNDSFRFHFVFGHDGCVALETLHDHLLVSLLLNRYHFQVQNDS